MYSTRRRTPGLRRPSRRSPARREPAERSTSWKSPTPPACRHDRHLILLQTGNVTREPLGKRFIEGLKRDNEFVCSAVDPATLSRQCFGEKYRMSGRPTRLYTRPLIRFRGDWRCRTTLPSGIGRSKESKM